MFDQPSAISFQLPPWVNEFAATYRQTTDAQQQMAFVLAAAQRNIEKETGGPFAAAIFAADNGELVALGVNLVTTQGLSALHAEVVAISLAQRKFDTYDLSEAPRRLRLVSSTEPCAMCLGAIPWSGVGELITGAREEDARAIGFDEGAKPENWSATLDERGIQVTTDILRRDAKKVLQHYLETSGTVYNASKD